MDHLPITLTVYDPRNGEEVQSKRLDFLCPADRQNIAKTAWWAMHNGYEVRTSPDFPGNPIQVAPIEE